MSMAPLNECEVWFLTGSQDLYGEKTLAEVEKHSREVAKVLDVHHLQQADQPCL